MPPLPPPLAAPAMPQPRMQTPEMALLAAARQLYDSAKLELRVRLETVTRYQKAWVDSKKQFGENGDPQLRQTADMEYVLYRRQVEGILRPAAIRYAEAVQQAVRAGQFTIRGSLSPEKAFVRLLDLQAEGQTLDYEVNLSPSAWAEVIDAVARTAARMWSLMNDERGLQLGITCVSLAQSLGVEEKQEGQGLKAMRQILGM